MSGVDIELAGRALTVLLAGGGKPVVLNDVVSGVSILVPPDSAGAADGLLPVFLAAAGAVWREATGTGFGLEMENDEGALLGWRVKRIAETQFSAVMLAVMEVASQAARPEGIVVNDLAVIWEEANERFEADAASRVARPPVRGVPA